MKHLLFVSSGRCGTVRLTQILKEKLPENEYAVVHQMKYSRPANVIGNILFCIDGLEQVKEILYPAIVANYRQGRHFICTDPLTAMIIPKSIVNKKDTYIVHIERDHDEFARSMVALTCKRWQSWIAHNLIPFWQPGILPFENQLRGRIHGRYKRVSVIKNQFFAKRYAHLHNYYHFDMKELFASGHLTQLIQSTLGETIEVTHADLVRRANES